MKKYSLQRLIRFRKNSSTLIRFGVLLCCIIVNSYLLLTYLQLTRPTISNITEAVTVQNMHKSVPEKEKWASIIDRYGAEKAYSMFKNEANHIVNPSTRHALAHIIGGLLYEKIGLEGVEVCDDSFNSGCYHSYLSQAINAEGIAITKALYEKCRINDSGGCIHGIGHGAMYYFGDNDLVKALQLCSSLLKGDRETRCTSGVFMEYNFHTTNNPDGQLSGIRQQNSDIYYPCSNVPEVYRPACYFELPAWWKTALSNMDYQAIGALCAQIQHSVEREYCDYGIGFIITPETLYNPDETIASCLQLQDKEATLNCRAGASASFLAMSEYKQFALAICMGQLPIDIQTCQKKASTLAQSK
jgi:hypothetical protein